MSDTDSIKDEKIVYNPYNSKNKLVTVQDIENILKRNGVTLPIKNLAFYQEAFVHKSYLKGMIEQDNPDKEEDYIVEIDYSSGVDVYTLKKVIR